MPFASAHMTVEERLVLERSWSRSFDGAAMLVVATLLGAAIVLSSGPNPGRADILAAASATAAPGAPTPAPTPTPFAVTIDRDGFHPNGIHIYPGQNVTWTNADTVQHTATAADGSWDTGPIDPGRSATLQFLGAGRWEYLCGFKPVLRATLVVATPPPAPHGPSQPPAIVASAPPQPTAILSPSTPQPAQSSAGGP